MNYPRFNFNEEQKDRFIYLILEISSIVEISRTLMIIKDDPDDNITLETAVSGNADYLVSGDPHLLKLERFECINIIKVSDILKL